MALIFLRHVILTVVSCSMMSYATVSRTFKVKVNSSGTKMCAVDKPSTVIAMAASTMAGQCGVQCNVDPYCQFFQFKEDMAQCEMFKYSPSNFSIIDHCTAYSAPADIKSGKFVTSQTATENSFVQATTILDGKLIVTGSSIVEVYNTQTLQLVRLITYSGLGTNLRGFGTNLQGLAACALNNYLYISDNVNNTIHRVDLSVTNTTSMVRWSAPGGPVGLSLTSVGNVLVVAGKNVGEYTPNGTLVRVITSSNYIWQAVELTKDIWAFSALYPLYGICRILTNGILINCCTSAIGTTNIVRLRGLAVDSRGYILAVDYSSGKIIRIDPSLSEASQLPLVPSVSNPVALSFDNSRSRLYIGEYHRRQVKVFDIIS